MQDLRVELNQHEANLSKQHKTLKLCNIKYEIKAIAIYMEHLI